MTANDERFGIGIVFRLSPQTNGTWKETTLLTFNGENCSGPVGGSLLDAAASGLSALIPVTVVAFDCVERQEAQEF
jgi:hypothetical protein